ncbi:MAG: hypothetical protein WD048_07195 [Chitinophagales bacterium]
MQNWDKLGLLLDISSFHPNLTHSSVPCGFWIEKDILRIIFSSRNKHNQSIPFFIDYNPGTRKLVSEPLRIKLALGNLGTFDDSGIMPSCLIKNGNELWMYYIGWNLGVTVPFRNSIGLAISHDNGQSFEKKFKGPVLDRDKEEPHFVASNCVIYDDNQYKMWYLNCIGWEKSNSNLRHKYHIKYITSKDGFNWARPGKVAINFLYENEYAISVPRILIEDDIYKMWYSYRGGLISNSYRIGYAESLDGVTWIRKDHLIKLDTSNSGWDFEMLCYPFIFDYNDDRFMLYNGNGYGKTGFGIAKLLK